MKRIKINFVVIKIAFSVILALGYLSETAYSAPLSSSSFTCPTEYTLVQGNTPDGDAEWCEDKEGKKEGEYQVYYSDGKNIKILSHFKNNLKEGHYLLKAESGSKLREGQFKEGKLEGPWKRYYSNGKLKDQGAWLNDQPEGFWQFYRENGMLEDEGYYEAGKPVCLWLHYNEFGQAEGKEKEDSSSDLCKTSVPASYRKENKMTLSESFASQRLEWNLKRFSLGFAAFRQKEGNHSETVVIGYEPSYRLMNSIDWISGLSLGLIKTSDGEAGLAVDWSLSSGLRYFPNYLPRLFTEIRLGIQSWQGLSPSFAPVLKLGYDLRWKETLFFVA